MENTKIKQVAQDAEQLFKIIMKLYWSYITNLEAYIKSIPETDTETLTSLNDHMQEVQSALEHDIALFEKAILDDLEDISAIRDQLKIDDIHKRLK